MRTRQIAPASSSSGRRGCIEKGIGRLDVEAEVDHVTVLHDVVLAFQPPLAGLFGLLLAATGDEVVIRDDLGADEAALEIGVDHAGGLRRGGADRDGPGAHLFFAGGKIGLQPEQRVAGADHANATRLVETAVGEEFTLDGLAEFGDLVFDVRALWLLLRALLCGDRGGGGGGGGGGGAGGGGGGGGRGGRQEREGGKRRGGGGGKDGGVGLVL